MLFNEKEMSLALAKLFELFSPSDYEAFDYRKKSDMPVGCACRKSVGIEGCGSDRVSVFPRRIRKRGLTIRGVELFNQRGCLIISDEREQMVFDEAETIYATELWLLEDMTFCHRSLC